MAEEEEGAGRIDTVVLLMLENRSFDHMLGWMKRLNPEIDGVTGEEWNPVRAGGGNKVFFKDTARYVDPDPGHSFEAVTEQVFGTKTAPPQSTSNLHAAPAPPPPMNGFAEQAETVKPGMSEVVMNGFGPEALPVFAALVQEFAVFDRWFASLPTLTQPNRLFVHSATSHGEVANDNKNLLRGYPQRTVFESLLDSGRDFGVYYQSFPNVLFYRRMRNPRYARKFHRFDERFADHARAGRLPNYVVIEPRYFDAAGLSPPANDDHPAHDVAEGQRLVKSVYETLRASPHWNRCLLLITYDEHGGFFDHVPTPVHGVPNPDGRVSPPPHSFAFDRLGVRVPTIAVSPWIEPRTVVHEPRGPFPTSQYEHSSVPATVKKLLRLTSAFLTKRDEWAGTFEHILFQRHTPRTDCPETLPSPPKLRDREAQEDAPLSEFQREMVELAAYLKGGFFRHRSRGLDGDEEEEQQQQEEEEEEEEMQSIVENMVVREARELVDEAVEQFFGEGLKLHDEDDIDENGNGRHGRGSSSDEEEQQQEGHKHTQHHGPMRLLHKLLH